MQSNIPRIGSSFLLLGMLLISLVGCSFGPNSPNVRNALDMLRIERDAAEDEYYALKQKHDEALWKIEDLETQIKSIQEDDRTMGASYEQLDRIDSVDRGFNTSYESAYDSPSEYPRSDNNAEYVEPQSPSQDFTTNSAESAAVPADSGNSSVSYVDVDPRMTRGFDSHGKSGDDGIVVALKPMDANDQFVPIAAPVTISLIDPARNGIRQRVGLWKFTAQQVANRIDFKNGVFMFRLPWQRNNPVHSDLKLFVRYQANDGKREMEMDLPVALDDAPLKNSTLNAVPVDRATVDRQPKAGWTTIEPGPESNELPPSTTFTMSDSDWKKEPNSNQSDTPLQIARPEWSPYR